jgi:hypothetical protein
VRQRWRTPSWHPSAPSRHVRRRWCTRRGDCSRRHVTCTSAVASARAVTSHAAEVVYAVVASARAVTSLAAEGVYAVVASARAVTLRAAEGVRSCGVRSRCHVTCGRGGVRPRGIRPRRYVTCGGGGEPVVATARAVTSRVRPLWRPLAQLRHVWQR